MIPVRVNSFCMGRWRRDSPSVAPDSLRFIKNSKIFSTFARMEAAATHVAKVASPSPQQPAASATAVSVKGNTKRLKKDPPSPAKSPPPVSLDTLLEEIRSLKPFMEDASAKLQFLTDKWSQLDERMVVVEQSVSSVQETNSKVHVLQSQVSSLRKQVEDLENRSRRNNLRIYGLPENSEGSDPISFFRSFLPKLLNMPTDSVLNIQRAHRLGRLHSTSISIPVPRPRGIILYFLEYTDLLKVLAASKKLSRIVWSGHTLYFSQDYAKATADRRKAFLQLRPQLRDLGARYGLFHPCLFKVTYNNKTTAYDDPLKLKSFLNSSGSVIMDTSAAAASSSYG